MNYIASAKRGARRVLARTGYEITRLPQAHRILRSHPDLDSDFARLYVACAPFTATSPERMYSLWTAVCHVHRRAIPGDIVECGVWRGGSSMLAAMTLHELRSTDRRVFLFDTFSGMTEPSARDGRSLLTHWEQARGDRAAPIVAYASLGEVRSNMARTPLDPSLLTFVQGRVEDTIPARAPAEIAVLRLDTDWYDSTRHELEDLWPRLQPGGVLIIDDYGHYDGARTAVDEYFARRSDAPLLHRIDYTGRIALKC